MTFTLEMPGAVARYARIHSCRRSREGRRSGPGRRARSTDALPADWQSPARWQHAADTAALDHEPRFGGTRCGGPSCEPRGRSSTFGTAIARGLEECEREPIMSETLPVVYLARHGETAWTISRQHTGLTDLPLTAQGEGEAARLGQRLEGLTFAAVLTSPLQRAIRTCELAGFASAADIEPDLVEWNYGAYEGCTARRSTPSVRTGSSSATVARKGSRPSGSALGPTGRYAECGPSTATRCSSRAGTSCECLPRAGSACRPGRAGTSSSARPA